MRAAVFGLVVSSGILASAAAHAFLGWPIFQDALAQSGVDDDVVAALGVAWHFGSASMLAFGAIVAAQAVRRIRGLTVDAASLWTIALVYVAFGTTAYTLRGFNPHFLLFVVTGVLVGTFAALAAAGRDSRDPRREPEAR